MNNEIEENYIKEIKTINLIAANFYVILMLVPITFIYGLPYYLIWHNKIGSLDFKNFKIFPENISENLVVFLVIIIGIVLHEAVHGITWAKFAKKGFKSIKFGFLWKGLAPYCHCKEPLIIKHYILGAIMPAIIVGLLPALVSMIIGSFQFLIFGIFFTMCAGGDFMIIHLLRKENMDSLVQDHPSEAGCYIYRR